MNLIEWSTEYELGDDVIDYQHRELVRMINNLHEAHANGSDELLMEVTLDELVKYTQTHFTEEESTMKKLDYPDLENHLKAHQQFIQQISDFKKDFYDGRATVTEGIIKFLQNWLINHIQKTDREMVAIKKTS